MFYATQGAHISDCHSDPQNGLCPGLCTQDAHIYQTVTVPHEMCFVAQGAHISAMVFVE